MDRDKVKPGMPVKISIKGSPFFGKKGGVLERDEYVVGNWVVALDQVEATQTYSPKAFSEDGSRPVLST